MTSLDGRSPISSPPVLTAIYGDSRTANCFSGNAPDVIMEGYGYAMWAQGFAEGAIRIPPELAFGEGGDTSTMALDRIGQEIGRASWRERGGQTVENSVG